MVVKWKWSQIQNLAAREMHDILAARQSIFIVEQRCAYQDADHLDHLAWHLTGRVEDGQLAAYLRVNPPGSCYAEPSIGRLLTVKTMRGQGLARIALQQALARCEMAYPGHDIRIAAQVYLATFYRQFAFQAIEAPYDEDGIAHVDMIRRTGLALDSD